MRRGSVHGSGEKPMAGKPQLGTECGKDAGGWWGAAELGEPGSSLSTAGWRRKLAYELATVTAMLEDAAANNEARDHKKNKL